MAISDGDVGGAACHYIFATSARVLATPVFLMRRPVALPILEACAAIERYGGVLEGPRRRVLLIILEKSGDLFIALDG
jgi:hypothetical protein